MSKKIDLKMPAWLMGQDPGSKNENLHYMTHLHSPQFTARWCFGPPNPKPRDPDSLYIEDGEGDLVHVFDFQWLDAKPDQAAFQKLMNKAIDAVDQWLDNNLAPPMK